MSTPTAVVFTTPLSIRDLVVVDSGSLQLHLELSQRRLYLAVNVNQRMMHQPEMKPSCARYDVVESALIAVWCLILYTL